MLEEETTVAKVTRDHLAGHADVGDVANGAALREVSGVVRHVASHHLEQNFAFRDFNELVIEEHFFSIFVELTLICPP